MPKSLIFDAFTLLICEKNVANYALLRCKIFSLKIWVCKIFDKFHVCILPESHDDLHKYNDNVLFVCLSAATRNPVGKENLHF